MATRQYIGARYVPKFYQNSVDGSTQWEPNVVYEPLVYVTLQNGHMYISKKQVPATIGTPASNVDYWLDIGSYSGFIEQLQDEINVINAALDPMKGSIVTPESYGAKGDGVTDDTAAINNMLANLNGRIAVFTKTYLINGAVNRLLTDGGIKVKSNSTLLFTKNSKLVEAGNNTQQSNVVLLLDVENVVIDGITIIGDYNMHQHVSGTTDEWCHGLVICASKNVIVRNATIKNCYGDAISISQAWASEVDTLPVDNHCRNVTLDNIVIDKAGRNGITVGDCTDWLINNVTINNVTRTNPKVGIDVEQEGDYTPNVEFGRVSNVIATDCTNGAVKVTKCDKKQYLDHIYKASGAGIYLETNTGIVYISDCDCRMNISYTQANIKDSRMYGFTAVGNTENKVINCDITFGATYDQPIDLENCVIREPFRTSKSCTMRGCLVYSNGAYQVVRLDGDYNVVDNCTFDITTPPTNVCIFDGNGNVNGKLIVTNCKHIGSGTAISHAMVYTSKTCLVDGNDYFPFEYVTPPATPPVTGCVNFTY